MKNEKGYLLVGGSHHGDFVELYRLIDPLRLPEKDRKPIAELPHSSDTVKVETYRVEIYRKVEFFDEYGRRFYYAIEGIE